MRLAGLVVLFCGLVGLVLLLTVVRPEPLVAPGRFVSAPLALKEPSS